MNKFALLVAAVLVIGAYFYRDRLLAVVTEKNPDQPIYSWKDKDGRTYYSSDKLSAPAQAKPANLPEISIIESNKEELDKQAKRLANREKSPESSDTEKAKRPQVHNLALERVEKAAESIKR